MELKFHKPLRLALCLILGFSCFAFSEVDSDSHPGLKELLKRYPEADLNKDGKLSMDEVKRFRMGIWKEETDLGEMIEPGLTQESQGADIGEILPQLITLSYGNIAGQDLDLWLPRKGKAPFPTVIWISPDVSIDQPPLILLKECLQSGIAFCRVHEREDGDGDSYFEDLSQLERFLKERGLGHGIEDGRLALFGEGTAAEYVLWEMASLTEDNSASLSTKGVLLLDPLSLHEASLTEEDSEKHFDENYPRAAPHFAETTSLPPLVLLYTQEQAQDHLFAALRSRGLDIKQHTALTNEHRDHLQLQAALFFKEVLIPNSENTTTVVEE